MNEVEHAVQVLIPPDQFTPEMVGRSRKMMHNALETKGVYTVHHLAPVYSEAGFDCGPCWELNAWGVASE